MTKPQFLDGGMVYVCICSILHVFTNMCAQIHMPLSCCEEGAQDNKLRDKGIYVVVLVLPPEVNYLF